jgi:hypothetical protein
MTPSDRKQCIDFARRLYAERKTTLRCVAGVLGMTEAEALKAMGGCRPRASSTRTHKFHHPGGGHKTPAR